MSDTGASNLSISVLKQGDHICSIHKTSAQQFSMLADFFKIGIEKNEKYVYIIDENTKDIVISELEKKGIEVRKLIKSNKFVFLNAKSAYLNKGYFDTDRMVSSVKEIVNKALEEGYSGIRAAAEMTWVMKDTKGREKLIEYETKLNQFYPESKITSVCLFNETKFTPMFLGEIIHTHPLIFFYGNLFKNEFYYNPSLFFNDENQFLPINDYEFIKKDIMEGNK